MRAMIVVMVLLAGSAVAAIYRCEVDGVTQIQNWPCDQPGPTQTDTAPISAPRQPERRQLLGQPVTLDIRAHCESLRRQSGSYRLRNHCLESQAEARDRVNRMAIPIEVANYCNRLGERSGSYTLLEHCIKREIEAMRVR